MSSSFAKTSRCPTAKRPKKSFLSMKRKTLPDPLDFKFVVMLDVFEVKSSFLKGQFLGIVGTAVASESRDHQFESSHQHFLFTVN